MPSFRRQRGIITRPIPDWNVQNLCYGGVQNGFAALTSFNAGCTNADKLGGSFFIWDCTITVGRFSAATAPTVTFMSLGVFSGAQLVAASQATPMDPLVPAPPMFFVSNYNVTNLNTISSSYVPLSGEGTWRWTNPFPLAIIRPNLSLILLYQATQALVGFAAVAEYAQYP